MEFGSGILNVPLLQLFFGIVKNLKHATRRVMIVGAGLMRLMAVADVYDALILARQYRPAFTHETAVELIRQGGGEHVDPEVVDAMLAVEETFKAIASQFQVAR